MGTTDLNEDFTTARTKLVATASAIQVFTGNLTHQADSFVSIVERLNERFKELEERENELKLMEEKIARFTTDMEAGKKLWEEMERKLNERERIVEEKEARWAETEKKMAENASKLPSLINMNVGGKRFTTAKQTLLIHKGSYFESMLSTEHNQQVNGEFFIDRGSKLFSHVLEYLRSGSLDHSLDIDVQLNLEHEFAYYKIPVRLPFVLGGGSLLNEAAQTAMRSWIPNKHLRLIYKATKEGFLAEDFHRACDNKGATVTVIQSKEGFIFGGYSPLSWDSSDTWKTHPNCFIFTLSNPFAIPPSKYPIVPGDKHGIRCNPAYGPVFGGGDDIRLYSNSNQNNSSFTYFPNSYIDTSGKGLETFTGAKYFSTKEVEVYSAVV